MLAIDKLRTLVMSNAGEMPRQLAHGHFAMRKILKKCADRRVELDLSGIDEAHQRRRGHDLRDAADAKLRVGLHRFAEAVEPDNAIVNRYRDRRARNPGISHELFDLGARVGNRMIEMWRRCGRTRREKNRDETTAPS